MIMISGRLMMPKAFVATLLILVGSFLPAGAAAAEPVQKVRIGYPSSAVSTLPFDIAKEKGFYSRAGLDVEYIQMRTAIAPQAILNGNINFFTSPQSGISAAASGCLWSWCWSCIKIPRGFWSLRARINQTQDLIGKKIAISDLRSSPLFRPGRLKEARAGR